MKIVIGHKVLNLEELTDVAYLGRDLAEVVVDSQLYADLATAAPAKCAEPTFSSLVDESNATILLSRQQFRAALLVKLVQLLKLKKNAQKSTVDFILSVLNQPDSATTMQVSPNLMF